MSYYIDQAIDDLTRSQFVAQIERVSENPNIVRIRLHKGSDLLVHLSEQYTFTKDDYRLARPHLRPGSFILLVDRCAGATGEAEHVANHDNIRILTTDRILDVLASGG